MPSPLPLTRVRSRQASAGFTLIEMLVVISIIALLISILLPALGAARRNAQAIVCASQIRQVGIAFAAYTTDNDDWFPPDLGHKVPWTSGNQWPVTLAHIYLNIRSGGTVDAEVFTCPSKPISTRTAYNWNYLDYGYNYLNIGRSTRATGSVTPPARVGQIRSPSETILLLDAQTGPNHTWPGSGSNLVNDNLNLSQGVPEARHDRALNVLWVDGHDTQVKIEDPANPYTTLTSITQSSNWWDRK